MISKPFSDLKVGEIFSVETKPNITHEFCQCTYSKNNKQSWGIYRGKKLKTGTKIDNYDFKFSVYVWTEEEYNLYKMIN